MQKGLVSLIVPCYNMATKIHRLFDSILQQTYKKIEVILVDDGSTDNIVEIIKAYKSKFDEEGIILNYLHKENGGLGSAINLGLKNVYGEFLCWPDSDDYLTNDSVEKRLNFLLSHPEYNLVRSDAAVYSENDLHKRIGSIAESTHSRFVETNLIKNCLAEHDFPYCPGCHMVRMSALREVNPKLDIYEAPRGQNIQMLLPLIYRFKFGYIDEPLYNYIVYENSMSRGDDTYEKCVKRADGLHTIKLETLKRINFSGNDFQYYLDFTQQYYYHKRCLDALTFDQVEDFNNFFQKIYNTEFKRKVIRAKYLKKYPFLRILNALRHPKMLAVRVTHKLKITFK